MDIPTTLLISLALAMDAFAVAVAGGIAVKQLKLKHAFTMAAWFGSFQAVMPVIGWLAGRASRDLIAGVDHWVAAGLLFFTGCKMIREGSKIGAMEKIADPLNVWALFMLAIATSIDALAVGLSFAMLNISIIGPVLTIGGVTFAFSFVGAWVGNKIGHFFERIAAVAGGAILIAIGARILFTHLS